MDWKNHLEKHLIQKIEKTVKTKVKSPEVNKKTTSEKANFCSNTVFSLYLKIYAIKFHAAKPLAFSLHFLFRRDQNHDSNFNSKIIKMCEQIIKKTAPQFNSNSLNCKKRKHLKHSNRKLSIRLTERENSLDRGNKIKRFFFWSQFVFMWEIKPNNIFQ